MIEESGRVIAVEPDAVWVETLRRSGCGRCDQPGGCGNVTPSRANDRAGRVRALSGEWRLAVGDNVLVGVPEGAVLHGALQLYVLPLLALLVGALVGQALRPDDAGAVAGAAGGLVAGFLAARLLTRHGARDSGVQPVVLRRLSEPPPAACGRE